MVSWARLPPSCGRTPTVAIASPSRSRPTGHRSRRPAAPSPSPAKAPSASSSSVRPAGAVSGTSSGSCAIAATTAVASGAPRSTWTVLDGGPGAIGPYVTWSGASICCLGTSAHRHASSAATAGACAVPLLVVGPAWRPSDEGYRHLVVGLDSASGQSEHVAATASALAERLDADVTLIEVIAPGRTAVDVPPSAHLFWVAHGLEHPPRLFDTVAARRAAPGLTRFLDPGTVVVVGAPGHHRWVLGGVAGRLVRRAPCPVLVVPPARVPAPGTCCTAGDRRSRTPVGTRTRAAPTSRG